MSVRLRQLAPIVLVLGLTVGGFFVSRAHGEQDARHDSAHRAEIAATEVRDRVTQAATLVDGVRRFLTGHISPGVTTEQFGDIGARWLGPVGVPAAAWVQRVSDYERPGYERRTGHHIVEPTRSGGVRPPGPRESYLPATLVTGIPPMSVPGIDLSGASGVAAAVARPQTAYRVTATSLGKLPDGTAGLFLVQSAQRLQNGGIVEPGFVVLFVPDSWLLGAAADTVAPSPTSNPKMKITVGGGSTGMLRGAVAGSAFTALGQRFDLRVPVDKVRGNAAILPWIILAGGLVLAALAGALAVISGRRAKAKAELDRLFAISPDLIVVAGFDGYFKRVNPAFEALLGYTEQEALARPYIEFVHPDDRERTTAEAGRIAEGQTATSFDNRYVCKDGSYRWIEWTATPVVEEQLIYAVARDVTERRQVETDLREAKERNRALAEEQAALRRVATLVASGVPPEEVFAAVAQEVGQLLPVSSAAMGRYDPDGMFTTVSAWNTGMTAFPVGNRWTAEGKNVTTMVLETGGSARLDSFADASGPVGVAAREAGYRSAVGTPITVEGRLWGVMTAASTAEEPLPPDTETRLASFTELVATAIANAESRAGLARLAEEQTALRRVAELVAREAAPAEVFAAIAEEVGHLLEGRELRILRYEGDTAVVVGASGGRVQGFPVGLRVPLGGDNTITRVFNTGKPARVADYRTASGPVSELAKGAGARNALAVPVLVEARTWGAIVTGSETDEEVPPDAESRLEQFTELMATAISNAAARAEVERLADEQAALRRVATLVAQGVSPAEVFSALCEQVNQLLDAQTSTIVRLEADGMTSVVASGGEITEELEVGTRTKPAPGMVVLPIIETGRPARKEDYDDSSGASRPCLGYPIHGRGPDHCRRGTVGCVHHRDGARAFRGRHRGAPEGVHRARCNRDCEHRESVRDRPARRRPGGSAPGGDPRGGRCVAGGSLLHPLRRSGSPPRLGDHGDPAARGRRDSDHRRQRRRHRRSARGGHALNASARVGADHHARDGPPRSQGGLRPGDGVDPGNHPRRGYSLLGRSADFRRGGALGSDHRRDSAGTFPGRHRAAPGAVRRARRNRDCERRGPVGARGLAGADRHRRGRDAPSDRA